MIAEIFNSGQADGDRQDRRQDVPPTDPRSWTGQLETMVDPYAAARRRKVQTGFRGRKVRRVRDDKPDAS